MTETLGYARPIAGRHSKLLSRFAYVSIFFPLLFPALLYSEWLLATWALGHPPRPSIDDPVQIAGSSWMYGITALALFTALPAALAAFSLTVANIVINRPTVIRCILQIVVVLLSWIALYGLLLWDPGNVVLWWFD